MLDPKINSESKDISINDSKSMNLINSRDNRLSDK